jgi:hypothetical protein
MSYKRCLWALRRLKAETGKGRSDRHDQPNPFQDIVENIRVTFRASRFSYDKTPAHEVGKMGSDKEIRNFSGVSYEKS